MSGIVLKNRHFGGYRYTNCPECNHEIEIDNPVRLNLPYCGNCEKIVFDGEQNYCGWCGCELEKENEG